VGGKTDGAYFDMCQWWWTGGGDPHHYVILSCVNFANRFDSL